MLLLQTALAATLTLCQPYYDAKLALHGYRSCDGHVAVAPKYAIAQPFGKGGIAAVVDDKGWAYINRRGDMVIRPFIVDNGPDDFSDGLARYTEGGKFGFFNTSGGVVIPAQFEFAYPFAKGRAKVGEGCTSVPDGEHARIDCHTWRFIQKPPPRAAQRPKNV